MPPPTSPSTIDAPKKKAAKGQPNSPVDTNSSDGEVRGEATMNATMGAQGAVVAIIDRTTAVVPHEQNGVPTAAATEPTTAYPVRRWKSVAIRSVPT